MLPWVRPDRLIVAARALLSMSLLASGVPARAQGLPAGAPQPGAAADDSPGVSVTVSLDDAIIQSRLPFDVPFFFTGTIEPNFTAIALSTYEVRAKGAVTAIVTAFKVANTCESSPNAGARLVGTSSWEGTGTTFKLLVDGLEPQRYFIFCFDLRGSVPQAEFAAEARRVVSNVFVPLAEDESSDSVSVTMVQNIQNQLSMQIQEIGRRRAVPAVIPEGNLFHPARLVTRGDRFVRLMADVLDQAEAAESRRRDYQGQNDALSDLAGNLGDARQFLSEQVLAALPSARGLTLPDPRSALTIGTPFDPAPYNFDAVLNSLDEAVRMARDANNQGAENTIRMMETEVARMQRFASLFGREYDSLRLAGNALITAIELEARVIRISLGSSVLSADMNRNAYVSLDAGIAYPWDLETMAFYAATNIYFRPVNKNASLRDKGSFSRRFALTIGITTTIEDASRRASDLRDSHNSLLIGAGIRLTPSVRAGGGVLVFKEADVNPLITQTSVAVTPYVGLSFDINMAPAFSGLFPK